MGVYVFDREGVDIFHKNGVNWFAVEGYLNVVDAEDKVLATYHRGSWGFVTREPRQADV